MLGVRNIVGGMKITEPALDLAVALAIIVIPTANYPKSNIYTPDSLDNNHIIAPLQLLAIDTLMQGLAAAHL